MRLYVATTNPGKLLDFEHAAKGHLPGSPRVNIEPLPGLSDIPAPPEDGATFTANAVSKAIYYSLKKPGWRVMADDSGLEVDALKGQPGVRSARFADDMGFELDSGATLDERNNALLISLMARELFGQRTARYRCVLALARDGGILAIAEGTLEGRITAPARGKGGFGYDPLFYLPELDQTMAELYPTTRLGLSHRGRALKKLLEGLRPG
jgi:XTP/dITP diphosphohydrolase